MKVYKLASGFHWQCEVCAKDGNRFSYIARTILENTNKPLRDWFKVAHLMLTSKKGMSSRRLGRYMGFGSVKTAWLTGHKIRAAMSHKVSLLCTDQWVGYHGLTKAGYAHATIDHAKRQYVVGAVHTNTIEGFWSIVGTFHNVSKKYLHLYVAEFQFRYDNRFSDDIFGTAIEGC